LINKFARDAEAARSERVNPVAQPQTAPPNLHVLTLTPFYPTKNDDANGCFVAEPIAELTKLGVANSIFAVMPFYRATASVHASAPPAEGVKYPALPGGWGLASSGAFLFSTLVSRVRTLHARKSIDVIHAHGALPAGHAAMLLKRELGIPMVVSVHGLDAYADRQVQGRSGQWCRSVSRAVFQSADRVICISEHVREQVLAGSPSSKTAVVYNGADPVRFAPAADETGVGRSLTSEESQRHTADGKKKLLSIGNLIPIKGHELLLRAVAALGDKHPALNCDLVGDGPLREKLIGLANELGIGERVRFLGRRNRAEVAELMRSATLFVLPSSYEGLGCVYLEAMATGKAALGCREQGIEEIIRHGSNGWLVAPNDLTDLTLGLSRLLESSQLREFIAGQGRQTVLQNYTIERQAKRLLRVYEGCLRCVCA
jgi:teichuronic acid biosynthesis glycosyltransferase TuaC